MLKDNINIRVATVFILSLLLLIMTAISVVTFAETTNSQGYELTVTDNGFGLIERLNQVALYSYDVEKEKRTSNQIIERKPLSDPVKFNLQQAHYQLVLVLEGYIGHDKQSQIVQVIYKPVHLTGDMTFNILDESKISQAPSEKIIIKNDDCCSQGNLRD